MEKEKKWITGSVMLSLLVIVGTIALSVGRGQGDKAMIHSSTDFLVQNNTKEIGVNKGNISDNDKELIAVNKRVDEGEKTRAGMIAMQQSLLAGQARQEVSQNKQMEKTQEMAETVAGLEAYLRSFSVEGEE